MKNSIFLILTIIGLMFFISTDPVLSQGTFAIKGTNIAFPQLSINFPYGLSADNITLDGNDLSTRISQIESEFDSLSSGVNTLDNSSPKLGETNLTFIAFSDLNIEGPMGRKQTFLEDIVTPEINWDTHVDVYLHVNDTTTFSQTGTPKPGQTIAITCINTNDYNIELIWDNLGWEWQKIPSQIPANSWVTAISIYIDGTYYADASAQSATIRTIEGGSGRTSHPQGYLLVGEGPNSLGAASVGPGLTMSGAGQSRTLGLSGYDEDIGEQSVTLTTGGVNVYTNLTAIAEDSSVRMSAEFLFSGDNVTYGGLTRASYRYENAGSITVSTNHLLDTGSTIWAGWINGSGFPVLRMGGINEAGHLHVYNVHRRNSSLSTEEELDPWDGYVWTESFEGAGAENPISETTGVITFDAVDYYVHGVQSARTDTSSGSAAAKFLLPSSYGTASGRFSIRVNQSPTTLRNIMTFRTPSDDIAFYVSIGAARTIRVTDGNNANATTANTFSVDQWITIYYEYTKGTGANDAVVKIGWSNDGTKTSNSGNIATISNSNMTTDVATVQVRNTTGIDPWTVWYDAIVVHPTFTWAELPAGLPSGM